MRQFTKTNMNTDSLLASNLASYRSASLNLFRQFHPKNHSLPPPSRSLTMVQSGPPSWMCKWWQAWEPIPLYTQIPLQTFQYAATKCKCSATDTSVDISWWNYCSLNFSGFHSSSHKPADVKMASIPLDWHIGTCGGHCRGTQCLSAMSMENDNVTNSNFDHSYFTLMSRDSWHKETKQKSIKFNSQSWTKGGSNTN